MTYLITQRNQRMQGLPGPQRFQSLQGAIEAIEAWQASLSWGGEYMVALAGLEVVEDATGVVVWSSREGIFQ